MKNLLLTGFFIALSTSISLAANFTVTNLNDSGPGSLREALEMSIANNNEGDIINETDIININVNGIIELTTNEHRLNILPIPIDVILNGDADGDGNAIVLKTMTESGRFFQLTNSIVNDVIFDGGSGFCTGGAVLTQGSSFLNRCLMINSVAGAANHGCAKGGGIRILSGETTLTDCTLRNNTSGGGAAIWVGGNATLNLESCTIADNIVYEDAGVPPSAIYLEGTLNMSNTIIANTSPVGAVDVFDEGNTIVINDNNLVQNFVCRTGKPGCANVTFTSTDDPMLEPTSGVYFLYNISPNSPIAGMGIGSTQGPGGMVLSGVASAAPTVPTMGEWGVICLGILLLIFGVATMNNRNEKMIPVKVYN